MWRAWKPRGNLGQCINPPLIFFFFLFASHKSESQTLLMKGEPHPLGTLLFSLHRYKYCSYLTKRPSDAPWWPFQEHWGPPSCTSHGLFAPWSLQKLRHSALTPSFLPRTYHHHTCCNCACTCMCFQVTIHLCALAETGGERQTSPSVILRASLWAWSLPVQPDD